MSLSVFKNMKCKTPRTTIQTDSSVEEQILCTSKDTADLNEMLNRLAAEISSTLQPLQTLWQQVTDGELMTDKGVSFLEVT